MSDDDNEAFKFDNEKYKDFNLDNEKIAKASKWAIFFLIDLKAVFIISYVYVSVVNLISTTASSEATRDAKSTALFDVSPKYLNVNVSFINDAVLWNCRELSVTKEYYKTLYWMLLGAAGFILAIFLIVKIGIVCCAKDGPNIYLWRLAVLYHFHDQISCANDEQIIMDPNKAARCQQLLLLENEINVHPSTKFRQLKYYRIIILVCSVICLSIILILLGLSYDLHPLSCMFGPTNNAISFNNVTQKVEILYSDTLVSCQRVSAIFVTVLFIVLLQLIIMFAVINWEIIKLLKSKVSETIIDLEKQKKALRLEEEANNND